MDVRTTPSLLCARSHSGYKVVVLPILPVPKQLLAVLAIS